MKVTDSGEDEGEAIGDAMLLEKGQSLLQASHGGVEVVEAAVDECQSFAEMSDTESVMVSATDIQALAKGLQGLGMLTQFSIDLAEALSKVGDGLMAPLFLEELQGLPVILASVCGTAAGAEDIPQADGNDGTTFLVPEFAADSLGLTHVSGSLVPLSFLEIDVTYFEGDVGNALFVLGVPIDLKFSQVVLERHRRPRRCSEPFKICSGPRL
jgi:hypothetical protein